MRRLANDHVVVWFIEPVEGTDPEDGYTFRSNRHKVAAVRVVQDIVETTFVDMDGEIVARWPTSLVERVVWPALEPQQLDDQPRSMKWGTNEWIEETRKSYPRAYLRWDADEDARLEAEFHDDQTVDEMMAHHERQRGAIMMRLIRLGLIEKGARPESIGFTA